MRRALLLVIVISLVAMTACGASIQAVYEGDVRFEHCMALDSRSDIKPTLQRACWEEWVKFYTFGQTRDRVEYAKLRQKQLSDSSNFAEAAWAPAQRAKAAVPEPTSVLEPPPMTLVSDGGPGNAPLGDGAAGDGSADANDAAAKVTLPGLSCSVECETGWNVCRRDCKTPATPACEKACDAKYKRCMDKCF